MAYSLTWLPKILRDAGLKVGEEPGWADRGYKGQDVGKIMGVICHHTGTPRDGNMPTLKGLREGVWQTPTKFLPGPLAQLGLGRDGSYYVVAAGLCNHAGSGEWKDISGGNTHFIGIEAENRGTVSDPWPEVQLDAYVRGVAAILKYVNASPEMCCAHREWAPRRKPDPHSIDMDAFRSKVRSFMNGTAEVRPPLALKDDQDRPTLLRGARGEWVSKVQHAVGAEEDGIYGPGTEAKVRAYQTAHNLVADGRVGPKTWRVIFPA